ncbi:MAG: deoxyribose-phosphate aldolase [Proteobacteria bacterium]|nr:deoxyribose-phosphate aldolase [Pseudomonadota bacterium]
MINNSFNSTLDSKKARVEQTKSLIDLTLLDESASIEQLDDQRNKANLNKVAAICVYPKHLGSFSMLSHINRATVVNFPSGMTPLALTLVELDAIEKEGIANEIDYVFPYPLYLNNEEEKAFDCLMQVQQKCLTAKFKLKVIIETGAFTDLMQIYNLSLKLAEIDVDFIKTSTGKHEKGASFEASLAILEAIKNSKKSCGIKISGGVREPEDAFKYIELAEKTLEKPADKTWFRLGASSLLDSLSE